MLSIQAVRGLPRSRAPGIVPSIAALGAKSVITRQRCCLSICSAATRALRWAGLAVRAASAAASSAVSRAAAVVVGFHCDVVSCLGRGFKRCISCCGSGRLWKTDIHGRRHVNSCWHCHGTGRRRYVQLSLRRFTQLSSAQSTDVFDDNTFEAKAKGEA